LQIKTKIVSSQTADSKPVKQEVNGTVILPPLVFPVKTISLTNSVSEFTLKSFIRTILAWSHSASPQGV
jgi:hypothetical protein